MIDRTKFDEESAKREIEREKRFREIGATFNDLMIKFSKLHDDAVDYVCSAFKTSSVARVYSILLVKPYYWTFDAIWSRSGYSKQTVRKALRTLHWFGLIFCEGDEEENWGINFKNWREANL